MALLTRLPTLENALLIVVPSVPMVATAATATRPAASEYSIRSCPRVSFQKLLKLSNILIAPPIDQHLEQHFKHTAFAICRLPALAHGAGHQAADFGKRVADGGAERSHGSYGGDRHQTGGERVFDQVLSLGFLPQISEKRQH